MKKEITYAFIDSQNLNLAVKGQGWKLDFKRFLLYLRSKYGVSKAFVFIGYVEGNEWLYKSLEKYGYNLVFKQTVVDKNKKFIKGNVDAELVLHSAKIEYGNYDKAVIVSNDGDFYCLIDDMVNEKRLKKIIAPSFKYSSLLRPFVEYILPVPLIKNKVKKQDEIQKRSKVKSRVKNKKQSKVKK